MKRKIGLLSFFTIVVLLSGCTNKEIPIDQEVYEQTIIISNEYIGLRMQTDEILRNADQYSYQDRNNTIKKAILQRQSFEQKTDELRKLAEKMSKSDISFSLFSHAFAYEKSEISDIFDKAPAGRKIATLAKHLGVDAKTAFKIIKNDQAQVEADARNEAGDTFQKLETSAILIKDSCKVAGYVGGIAVGGGISALAGKSLLTQATTIVGGADLVLEVTDDGAKIALGNHNKISSIVNDIRTVTEPMANILTITDIPNNLETKFEKFSAIMVAVDQFNSAAQDGKIVGIQLPVYKNKTDKSPIKISVLEKNELDKRLQENGTSLEEEQNLNEKQIQELEKNIHEIFVTNKITKEEAKIETIENGSIVGIWEGIGTSTNSSESQPENFNRVINFMADNTISANIPRFDENEVLWEQEGNKIKMYEKEGDGSYYLFELNNNTLVFLKMEGPDAEGKRSEVVAGSDFFGGKFFEITLKKK